MLAWDRDLADETLARVVRDSDETPASSRGILTKRPSESRRSPSHGFVPTRTVHPSSIVRYCKIIITNRLNDENTYVN